MELPLPATLTPSKLTRFMNCPLSFRYSYIDHLPEPSSRAQVLGTLVHRALELLFSEPDEASSTLERAWQDNQDSSEVLSLELDATGEDQLRRDASVLLERYRELEDPNQIKAVGLELDLRTTIEGIEFRGIVDRLDVLDDGGLAIVDYKTGRAPRQDMTRPRMLGVLFYALLCEHVLGRRPSEVRLMYLKDRVVVVESPTDQTMRGILQRALAVWKAIERACATGDFRPKPSRLCASCAYQSICPAMGASEQQVAASR